MLSDVEIPNHGIVNRDEIGDTNTLQCLTNNLNCCQPSPSSRAFWYYPNSTEVVSNSGDEYYSSREGPGFGVYLHRRDDTEDTTGNTDSTGRSGTGGSQRTTGTRQSTTRVSDTDDSDSRESSTSRAIRSTSRTDSTSRSRSDGPGDALQGIFHCQIPNGNGEPHSFYVGIYDPEAGTYVELTKELYHATIIVMVLSIIASMTIRGQALCTYASRLSFGLE